VVPGEGAESFSSSARNEDTAAKGKGEEIGKSAAGAEGSEAKRLSGGWDTNLTEHDPSQTDSMLSEAMSMTVDVTCGDGEEDVGEDQDAWAFASTFW
jgi:hypothetical protein